MDFDIYILAVGLIILAYYLYISSSAQQRSRIWDLLIIGFILWAGPVISNLLCFEEGSAIKVSGFLIFIYGWIIFIIEKFHQGRKSK